ncbi:alpha-L-arabinofuranosidase [Curtobacterium sp. MCBD17_034]|uniref:arabinofuranosidase catalytic domain-containing protein n=1 Tax=unclassified Curtobacterium TaxID=257496 RepID=UPI000DA831B6|nr:MULTISPECIES: arabinofuranosidase catalytic domain-containing protein [unclassified Curtobacterium]PZF62018.1 alpha-L-arabinofuranosidase [Curtobacterium sp. MCBD17_034]PZM34048.1 alpha-L-arabinofuranosidase [Curtobacterium sp. MCBD17_031]WIB67489.1 arabinofuranosidase catalytic domain-containing protein [Curtobacterium sp. MCBD17_035]
MHIGSSRIPRLRRIPTALLGALALVAGTLFAATAGAGGAAAATSLPCDVYGSAGTSCVAAYSSTRALSASYNGPLYQVQRASDGATTNIGLLSAGGYVNAATQDTFCAGTTCTIPKIYDQTANHNDLTVAPAGDAGAANHAANATALPITVAGHEAYGLYMPPQVAYRIPSTAAKGTARGASPESMYEVASGTNSNNGCCSDFGNVETQEKDTGQGHMDALNLSTLNAPGSSGKGPWVQADLENGVFQGGTPTYTPNTGNNSKFVTAELKNNGTNKFALKGGNSQTGSLTTWYEGPEPAGDYTPMKLEGSIVLGAGGDNSNRGTQSFFEGVMTTGYSTDAADNAVQSNIVAQNYQGVSTGGGPGSQIVGPGGKCVDVSGDDTGGNLAVVQLWDCSALAADQHWSGTAYGTGTLGTLGRCLDADGNGTANGTHLELYDCNGVGGQQWIVQGDGSIKNPQSGRCLDDPSGNTANGTALQLYDCNGNAAQKFTVAVPIIGNGGKCVDVAGDDLQQNGQQVQLYDCLTIETAQPAAQDQQWTVDQADHTIRTLGRCLDADGNATANGTHVELYQCNGVGGQQWIPQANGSILNPQSGRCLDDPSGNTANATALQLYDCNGNQAQVFTVN